MERHLRETGRATGHHDANNLREEHTVVNTQDKTSKDQNTEDTLPSLQDQIAEAIQPLIGDLHEQISQTLRESLNAGDGSSEDGDGEQDQQQQEAQQDEDDEQEPQAGAGDEEQQESQQANQADEEASDEDETAEDDEQDQSPMALAMMQTGEALRSTFVELGKTVQHLLKTVQELLQAVASLVKLLVTALKEGLGGGGDGSIIGTVLDKGKEKVGELAGNAVSSLGGGDEGEGNENGGLLNKGKNKLMSLVSGEEQDDEGEADRQSEDEQAA
jgi:DNA mismatch repair ATPase MutL